MNTTATSRQLVQQLTAGDHALSNQQLRDAYGLNRVTAKARRAIAHELKRAGLEVLSDPSYEPLVVRKTAKQAATRRTRTGTPWWRRRWAIGLAAVFLLLMIVGATSESDTTGPDPGSASATAASANETQPAETAEPPTGTQPAEPVQTIEDSTEAVEDRDYAGALVIAAALAHDDRNRVRRAISRHLAGRVRAALRSGDRPYAKSLLSEADRYPATPQIRNARGSYRAAKARAAYRAEQRRVARAAARQRAADRRAAERAKEAAAAEASAPSYDEPSYDEPASSGPSTTNWCGKRDGDGDGIYCEGE